jgi:hypothetical protein
MTGTKTTSMLGLPSSGDEAAALRKELARTQETIHKALARTQSAVLDDLSREHALLAQGFGRQQETPLEMQLPPSTAHDGVTQSVIELITRMHVGDASMREDAIDSLADLVADAYGSDGVLIGNAMRRHDGISEIVTLIADDRRPRVRQQALAVLANLCSDAVDANSRLSKRELMCNRVAAPLIFSQLAAEDDETLMFACGAVQNLSDEPSWATYALQHGVDRLLQALLVHPNPTVV